MRILLLIHYWEPEIGAPQKRWQWLARGLVERGHELAVLTPAPHYPVGRLISTDARHQTGAVHRDPSTGAMIHRTAFRSYDSGIGGRGVDQAAAAADAVRLGTARFAGVNRPDVIIGSVPGLPTLPAALALGRAFRRPVIAEMRDAWPDILHEADRWSSASEAHHTVGAALGATAAAVKRSLPAAITALQREASAIVTTTDAFGQVLRDRGMRHVATVRNCAGSEMPVLPTVPDRRDDDSLHVLYLGTLGRAQGLASAVRAAAIAQGMGVRLRLRIVGDGAERHLLEAEARRLDAPIDFQPPVAHSAVAEQYAWADTILVSLQDWPSMSLTVPSKLYEAMAVGRHVSGALAGEAAQILMDSLAGTPVTPQRPEALASLWTALSSHRDRLSASGGRAWLEAHTHETRLVSTYERILQELAHA